MINMERKKDNIIIRLHKKAIDAKYSPFIMPFIGFGILMIIAILFFTLGLIFYFLSIDSSSISLNGLDDLLAVIILYVPLIYGGVISIIQYKRGNKFLLLLAGLFWNLIAGVIFYLMHLLSQIA